MRSEKISPWSWTILGLLYLFPFLFKRTPSFSHVPQHNTIHATREKNDRNRDCSISTDEQDRSAVASNTKNAESEADKIETSKTGKQIFRFGRAGSAWIPFVTLLTLVAYTAITRNQWEAVLRSNQQTRRSLEISEKAYVTIGRPDGVVADIVMPKNPKDKAGIVVYFQNTGHLPAKFNWGSDSTIVALLPADPNAVREPYGKDWSEFNTDHFFQPMWRAKSRKQQASFSWSGTIMIPGNSSYQGVLWEITKERLLQLMSWDRPLVPSGKFDYCDGFGHHVCRKFNLNFAREPYNRFFLAFEDECSTWEMQVLHPDPTLDYLSPCEVQEGREELRGALKSSPKP